MNTFEQRSQSRWWPAPVAAALAVIVLAFGAYLAFRPATPPGPPPDLSDARTAVIPIEGMTCAACVAQVRRTLAREDGVYNVEVNLQTRTATVQYDPGRIQPERAVELVNESGYRAGTPAGDEGAP